MALKPRGIIEIPNGRDTSFDHGAFDPKTRRVFIAHTARDCVDVIDHDTSRHIATLPGFPEAASVVAHDGNVLITNRGAASVAWLDAATMQTRFASPTVPRPSAVRPLKHRGRQVTGVDVPFVVDWWRECRGAQRGRDGCSNRRGVGPPRKHLPRKRLAADLRSLARGHTELCIKVLAGIVSQEAVPPAARVTAAGILLDRGWGKAPQAITGENSEGGINVIIRHIVHGRDVQHQPLQIDAVPDKTYETDDNE